VPEGKEVDSIIIIAATSGNNLRGGRVGRTTLIQPLDGSDSTGKGLGVVKAGDCFIKRMQVQKPRKEGKGKQGTSAQ